MIHIQKFNERYQPNVKDTLDQLKSYFTTEGVYTEKLLDHFIVNTTMLVIELDIPSGFKGGKAERDRVKYYLSRAGFEPAGTSQLAISLTPDDLEWVKNFFSNL
jgi:hypothetical protein